MKKFAHTHSALVQNRQFRTRIARKECSHFIESAEKLIVPHLLIWKTMREGEI